MKASLPGLGFNPEAFVDQFAAERVEHVAKAFGGDPERAGFWAGDEPASIDCPRRARGSNSTSLRRFPWKNEQLKTCLFRLIECRCHRK
jgi:hypothetical protein